MSITSVAPFRPAVPFAPPAPRSKSDTPAPAPAPSPAPDPGPTADIDFSSVDSPQKAMLLPNLNAVSFLVNLSLFSNCLSFGAALDSTTKMTLGQSTPLELHHSLADPKNPSMQVSGNIGGNQVSETWTVDPSIRGIKITGTVGGSQEQLVMKNGPGYVQLDGTVGSVEVHEKFKGVPGNKLLFQGTVGGQKLNQTLSIKDNGDGTNTLSLDGKLGDSDLKFDASDKVSDTAVTWSGQGNIAGNPATLNQTATITVPQKK